jgi:hypothetical protein
MVSRHEEEREEEILEAVARRFGHLTPAHLSKLTHRFPEWIKNQPHPGSTRPIPARGLREAIGRGADSDRILAEANAYQAVEELSAGIPR